VAMLAGCGDVEPEVQGSTCELSLDNLSGKAFVMLESVDRNNDRPNPMARMKFYAEEGELKAKYTVMSVSSSYDYECEDTGKEVLCAEPARFQDVCQALEVHEQGSCTKVSVGAATNNKKPTDEVLEKAIKDAQETVAKFRDGDSWEHFQLNNNNVGNKLQGFFYAKVEPRQCQLMIDDMYMTVYNGKRVEDYNPVGKNAFVTTDEEYLFETCDDANNTLDWSTPDKPKVSEITPERIHEAEKPVYYHYYGEKAAKAEADCTYSVDIWANWQSASTGNVIEPDAKGNLNWMASHTFGKDNLVSGLGQPGGIIHLMRFKDCEGKKERIDTLCNAAVFAPVLD